MFFKEARTRCAPIDLFASNLRMTLLLFDPVYVFVFDKKYVGEWNSVTRRVGFSEFLLQYKFAEFLLWVKNSVLLVNYIIILSFYQG